MNEVFYHEPVLINKAISYLLDSGSKKGYEVYVDCTLGGGGYTKKILEESPEAKVIAIDRDVNAIEYSKKVLGEFENRIIFVQDNFGNIKQILKDAGFDKISGIVMDLGLSSYQLSNEEGFSYQKNTSLDMRADKEQKLTAKDVLNRYDEKEIMRVLYEYGELRYGKKIAKEIVVSRRNRKFETTFDLVELLRDMVPARYLNSDLSKLFQAIRIEVNNELVNLKRILEDSVESLEPGARIAAISYHSLEDRIVKNSFRSDGRLRVLTKKPIEPDETEIAANSRARSAKLRVAEKI